TDSSSRSSGRSANSSSAWRGRASRRGVPSSARSTGPSVSTATRRPTGCGRSASRCRATPRSPTPRSKRSARRSPRRSTHDRPLGVAVAPVRGRAAPHAVVALVLRRTAALALPGRSRLRAGVVRHAAGPRGCAPVGRPRPAGRAQGPRNGDAALRGRRGVRGVLWLNVILTVLWFLTITNAIQFLDGMDGLAAGLGVVAGIFFSIVSLQTGQRYLMFLSAALVGACLGFLPYNFRPGGATIFLG